MGLSAEDRHQRRMPREGKYSVPDKITVRQHQTKMRRMGIASYGLGASMRLLGYASMGYLAYQVYQDPSIANIERLTHDSGSAITLSQDLVYGTGWLISAAANLF